MTGDACLGTNREEPAEVGALLRRARDGDRIAFGVLYEEYRDLVLFCFQRMGARSQEGWDLTQETFLHAWRGLGTLDLETDVRFGGWLRTIARNVLRKHWISEARGKVVAACLDVFPEIPDPMAAADKTQDDAREDYSPLYACLDALDPEDRCLVLLRTVLGHSYRTMSSLVQSPEATVRYRLAAALRRLRTCLREKGVTDI